MTTLTVPSSEYPTIQSAVDAAPKNDGVIQINGAHNSASVLIEDKHGLELKIDGSLSNSLIRVDRASVLIESGRLIGSRLVASNSDISIFKSEFEARGLDRVIECGRCYIEAEDFLLDGAGEPDDGLVFAVYLSRCGGRFVGGDIRNTRGRNLSTALYIGDGSFKLDGMALTDNTQSASGGAVRAHNCTVSHFNCRYERNGEPGIDPAKQLGVSGEAPHHHIPQYCTLSMEPVAEEVGT